MKIGIVACGAIVREMLAIARRQGWDVELTAVPAQYHNHPHKIAPAVGAQLEAWVNRFDLILVGYADCGTRGALDALLCEYPQVVRIDGPHCYEFYSGVMFTEQMSAELGTFFLTDFLARHFDGLVWRGLGLDRFPELLPVYFGNYRQVVYLRQAASGGKGADDLEDALSYAEAAAARLGLPLQVVETGLATLEARLVAIVEAAQAKRTDAAL